ncbi:conserved hypothetical protein [Luminiphilus syltensis NOR5-1B]|uniref:Fatty acid hydroxylase domain-containing protein n=1 Tax=Luminiphilus syltensis NOR5-1B TaxID=565045 RepID=B8KV53_9GAMM|nr:sterol desaturase family protein [Luminiphilus syltensis]EED34902.1 conserved hypothetical protein [Luminiphilus syltensis NOR5-1B]
MEQDIVIQSSAEVVLTATLVIFAVAMLLEGFIPARKPAGSMLWRWSNNFSLGLVSWYTSAVVSTLFVVWLASWTQVANIGLLSKIDAGPVVGFFALLTATQFLSYWVHRAFHRWAWLWPLHVIHHSDTEVDASTTYRHHPLEPLISLPLAAPIVLALGVSPESALAYRLFDVGIQVFSHSNLRLPMPMERVLRRFILTPDFHRVHHCAESHYTNSNYGSLVPWFDYLFGTAKHRNVEDHKDMTLGLEYLRETRDQRLDKLIFAPLRVPGLIRSTAASATNNTPMDDADALAAKVPSH